MATVLALANSDKEDVQNFLNAAEAYQNSGQLMDYMAMAEYASVIGGQLGTVLTIYKVK